MSARIIARIKKLLPGGKFARGVAVLTGGNVIGQLLTIAASPILTRLYTPEQMGVLAVYISITAILTVVLSLRYETAIALPESDRDALALVKLSLIIVLIMSLTVGLLAILFRFEISSYFKVPELATYLFFLPLSGLLLGSFTTFRVWCVRVHAFGMVGNARIKQVVSSLVIQIAAAPLGAGALIGGQLANQGAGTWSLGKNALSRPEMRSISTSELKQALVRYKKFPLVNTWASLLNRVSLQFPTLFFAVMFGPAAAGVYALANRTLKAPSAVVNSAINSVFLTAAAEAKHENALQALVFETHKYLCMSVVPSLLLIALLAPQIFSVVFGQEWQVAGDYARWMTLLVYCTIVVSPFMGLFAVLERQEIGFVFQLALFLIRLLAFYLGSLSGDPVYTVALFSLFSAFSHLALMIWFGSLVGGGVGAIAIQTVQCALLAMLFSSPVIIAMTISAPAIYMWLAGVISTALCLAHIVYILRRRKVS